MKTVLIGINSKYIHPSMGVYQLVTNSIHPVTYKEFTIKDDINSIIDFINSLDANVIGFSCYIWNVTMIERIIHCISDKIIFIGGPEASFRPEYFLRNGCSYVIKGEGEESFNELISYLDKSITIDKVSNLYYLFNNEVKFTYSKLPDLSLIKHDMSLIKDYHNRICYVESSRGCFFNCSYCLASTEKPVRFFPIEEVKSNLLYLLEHNARTIKFLDRSFNIRKDYMFDILSFIKEHDNNISVIQFEIVGDKFDNDIINLLNSMRKNMIRLEIGIQSTNKETIKEIRRIQDFDKLKENILLLNDNLIIHTDLIAGLPYEDLESFKKSFNDTFLLFTEELQLGFLKELQGTYISMTKDKHGYIFDTTSPYEVIQNSYITKEELDKIRLVEEGVDKFYNTGNFPLFMNYVFKTLSLNPFDFFFSVTKTILCKGPLSSFQFPELTKELYKSASSLVKDKEELLYVIKKDYLMRNKVKPKIWWQQTITRDDRRKVYEYITNHYDIDINTLYSNCHLERNGNHYFIIDYSHKKTLEINEIIL